MDLIQKCLFDNSCTDCLAMILVNYILGRDNPSAFDQSEKNIRFTIEKRSHICPIVEDVGVDMLKKLKEDNKK